MKERVIWRPNCIPPEQWEEMTREEQIAWWKESRLPPSPKSHMITAITHYEEGNIAQSYFVVLVAKLAAPEEIEEFIRMCPLDLMTFLKEKLGHYGADESQWPRDFFIASYSPWATAEVIKESRRLEQEAIWAGVRLLKKYL